MRRADPATLVAFLGALAALLVAASMLERERAGLFVNRTEAAGATVTI